MDVLFAVVGGHDLGYLGFMLWMLAGCFCCGFWSPFVLVAVVLINRRWNRYKAANPPPDEPVQMGNRHPPRDVPPVADAPGSPGPRIGRPAFPRCDHALQRPITDPVRPVPAGVRAGPAHPAPLQAEAEGRDGRPCRNDLLAVPRD